MLRDDKHQHVEEDEEGAEGDAAGAGEEVVPQAEQAGSEADENGCEHERGADKAAEIKSLFVQIHILIFEKERRRSRRVFFVLPYEACVDGNDGIEFAGPRRLVVRPAVPRQRFRGRLEDGGGKTSL